MTAEKKKRTEVLKEKGGGVIKENVLKVEMKHSFTQSGKKQAVKKKKSAISIAVKIMKFYYVIIKVGGKRFLRYDFQIVVNEK